jgi:hypothetical protein
MFIDFAQLKERFNPEKDEKSVNLQPFTTMQPPCNTPIKTTNITQNAVKP